MANRRRGGSGLSLLVCKRYMDGAHYYMTLYHNLFVATDQPARTSRGRPGRNPECPTGNCRL